VFEKSIHKIIFTGPVGAGKTSAIKAISDVPVVSTEQRATDSVKLKKSTTTVALDFGMLKLENGEKIHLYGTPGQQRFDFMWEVLVQNAIGIVILVDNANDDPLADLRFFLKSFGKFVNKSAVVVGITRTDLGGGFRLSNYHKTLREFDINPPIFEVDGRKQNEISLLLQALLFSVDQSIEEKSALDIVL